GRARPGDEIVTGPGPRLVCAEHGSRSRGEDQLKESPQAQELPALGLSIVKPCFSIVSAKSITAPETYGLLILSTITSTPSNSATRSSSIRRSSKYSW